MLVTWFKKWPKMFNKCRPVYSSWLVWSWKQHCLSLKHKVSCHLSFIKPSWETLLIWCVCVCGVWAQQVAPQRSLVNLHQGPLIIEVGLKILQSSANSGGPYNSWSLQAEMMILKHKNRICQGTITIMIKGKIAGMYKKIFLFWLLLDKLWNHLQYITLPATALILRINGSLLGQP